MARCIAWTAHRSCIWTGRDVQLQCSYHDCNHPAAAHATSRGAHAGCEALETLPHSIGALTSLRTLDLTGCSSVAWLPGSLSCLAALQRLSLARCISLAELSPRMSALTSLVSLDVGEFTMPRFMVLHLVVSKSTATRVMVHWIVIT